MSSIPVLPPQVILEIFSHLSVANLLKAMLVQKAWYKYAILNMMPGRL